MRGARSIIGAARGAATGGRSLARLHVAAVLALALAVVPVRDGAALAQTAQPATGQGYGTGQGYERRQELKAESPGPRQSGPLSAAQERALREGPLSPDPAATRRLKDAAAEKAGRASGGARRTITPDSACPSPRSASRSAKPPGLSAAAGTPCSRRLDAEELTHEPYL